MLANDFTIDIIRDSDAFYRLQPEWDALWARADGEHYTTFANCQGRPDVLGAQAPRRHELFCLVARRAGRMVGVWPLALYRKALLWRYARQLGPENGGQQGMLVEPGPNAAQIVRAMWQALLRHGRPDVVHLTHVDADSPLLACAVDGRWGSRRESEITPVAALRGTRWEEFRASRLGRARNPPEALQRKLNSQGHVELEIVADDDPRLPELIDWLIHHKRAWAERGNVGSRWLFTPDCRAFILGAMRIAGPDAQPLQLFLLTLDGKVLAANLLAVQKTRVDLYMNTYDAAYNKLSPGTALVDMCVRWAYENGMDFRFGHGCQAYKIFWSQGVHYQTECVAASCTAWGAASRSMRDTVKAVRERILGKPPGVPGAMAPESMTAPTPDRLWNPTRTPLAGTAAPAGNHDGVNA